MKPKDSPDQNNATKHDVRQGTEGEAVSVRELPAGFKAARRSFPGPRGAHAPLRVAVERAAHAELIAHAKSSLDAEICGVLAGTVCEDDEGLFVHVEVVIRGTAASGGSTHVTFTQETWSAIHRVLERDHPKLKIVGWYHSHPGFGVEFSEMDLFIQRNFFAGPTQLALVTDPVSGAVAVCVNTGQGIEYLPRIWVGGREQACQMPLGAGTSNDQAGETGRPPGDVSRRIQELEERVGQLVLAVDDQRRSLQRFLLFGGALFAVAVMVLAGYGVYTQFRTRVEPPRNIGFAQVPVRVGDSTALLGVSIVQWNLPPEMDVMNAAVEQVKKDLEKVLEEALTNAAAPGSLTNLTPVPSTSAPAPRNP
jgi:proteasome lid subunit RPN8/RPN11